MKKTYSLPQLLLHGDIKKITQSCNLSGSDTPSGDSSAFPGGGDPCYI